MQQEVAIHWFRRDLRLHDNAALFHALKGEYPVLPVFIFDKNILDDLTDKDDTRITFIHRCLEELQQELQNFGASLYVGYGTPEDVWTELMQKFKIQTVFFNKDYEPYARRRDAIIVEMLSTRNIPCYTLKDHVLMEEDEVLKDDGTPYTVFTPYSKKHKLKLAEHTIQYFPSEVLANNYVKDPGFKIPQLESIGFRKTAINIPSATIQDSSLQHYHETRNFPALNGTSRLSVRLRFGAISIRQLAKKAIAMNAIFLNELIWRDFYQMILFHFPYVVHSAFKPAYDKVEWRNNHSEFDAWCSGKTGYPLVDAGMRELNNTGYMHNRVRMVTASFLTKHLLIDWRWGETYFASKLLDCDLASNNGGWQWAAGSGCDAAPYFRIFNPAEQLKKFDPDCVYVRKWVPEFDTLAYPGPVVDHVLARNRVLIAYKKALN